MTDATQRGEAWDGQPADPKAAWHWLAPLSYDADLIRDHSYNLKAWWWNGISWDPDYQNGEIEARQIIRKWQYLGPCTLPAENATLRAQLSAAQAERDALAVVVVRGEDLGSALARVKAWEAVFRRLDAPKDAKDVFEAFDRGRELLSPDPFAAPDTALARVAALEEALRGCLGYVSYASRSASTHSQFDRAQAVYDRSRAALGDAT